MVIINPVLPWFDMITSLTFGLLRPIPANVGLMSDIVRIGTEHLVMNDENIVAPGILGSGKILGRTIIFQCPVFDLHFPTYVQVGFS